MKKLFFVILTIMISTSFLYAKKTEKDYIADLDSVNNEQVIVEAAKWAKKQKSEKAIPGLIELLSDSRDEVRLNAVIALGYIEDESAAEPLNKVILEDKSSNVRYAALLSSVRIGSRDSVDTWIKAKDTETEPIILDFLGKMEEKAKNY